MDYIYIGKIITTHGIKGEIKIRSNFKYKEKAFKIDNVIYIGNEKEKRTILSYRTHQKYDMITLSGLTSIEEVIPYKNKNVYIKRNDLELETDEYTDEDYINCTCYVGDKEIGKVIDIIDTGNNNILLEIEGSKKIYVPKQEHFIKKFAFNEKKLYLRNTEGLL